MLNIFCVSTNLVRSTVSEALQGSLLADLAKRHFQWERLSVVFSHDQRAVRIFIEFQLRAKELGIKVACDMVL